MGVSAKVAKFQGFKGIRSPDFGCFKVSILEETKARHLGAFVFETLTL
jgi:hypothetical protein